MRTMHVVRGCLVAVLLAAGLLGGRSAHAGDDKQPVNPLRGKNLRLPTLSRVGKEAPARDRIVVSVLRDGSIHVAGVKSAVSLVELQIQLAKAAHDPARRGKDGASTAHVQLDVDETIPWYVCQWLMQICAGPTVGIRNISFGALSGDSLVAGAVMTPLPTDRGLAGLVPDTRRKVKAKVYSQHGAATDLALLYAALLEIPEAERKTVAFEIVAPPPKGGRVPWGYVARIIDVMHRTAGNALVFEGASMGSGPLSADPTWVSTQVFETRKYSAGEQPRIRLDLRGWVDELGLRAKLLPLVGRVEHRIGFGGDEAGAAAGDGQDPGTGKPAAGRSDFPGPAVGDASSRDAGAPGGAFAHRAGASDDIKPAPRKFRIAAQEALRWLSAHQSQDGSWEAANFGDWNEGKLRGPNDPRPDGKGQDLYDVGVTGLALQAFLAAGYTQRGEHRFAQVVEKGLRYLRRVQDRAGCFGPRDGTQWIYNHATAALAMVEAYGMTGSDVLKSSAQRALKFIAFTRNPYFAWRYGVQPGDNDTSISAWMTSALLSARLINDAAVKANRPPPLEIDDAAFEGVRQWLDKTTDPDFGRVGYIQRGSGSSRATELVDRFPGEKTEALTAAAVFLRSLLGQDAPRRLMIERGLRLLDRLPPKWNEQDGSIDMYYWYWGTLATYQAAGSHWEKWQQSMEKAVVDTQRHDGGYGLYRGSWDPKGAWGGYGGRVYATALQCLNLLVHTRYQRVK